MLAIPTFIPSFLPEFLAPILKKYSSEKATAALEKNKNKIVKKMIAENVAAHGLRFTVRWCLYWQCKAILSSLGIGSGTLADLWRDAVEDKILELVTTVSNEADAYDKTAEALIDLVW